MHFFSTRRSSVQFRSEDQGQHQLSLRGSCERKKKGRRSVGGCSRNGNKKPRRHDQGGIGRLQIVRFGYTVTCYSIAVATPEAEKKAKINTLHSNVNGRTVAILARYRFPIARAEVYRGNRWTESVLRCTVLQLDAQTFPVTPLSRMKSFREYRTPFRSLEIAVLYPSQCALCVSAVSLLLLSGASFLKLPFK